MKIFLAGATGALGRRLVPLLVANAYQVVAMTRSPEKAQSLRSAGTEPVVADGLDREAVLRAVTRAEPEVVIHQMTGLTGVMSFKKFDEEFAATNRLRTAGTDILLEAARTAGARRFIVQSYGGWNYERTGGPAKTEEDPFDPEPPAAMKRTLEAIRYLESAVLGAEGLEGVALRYGSFYGPGSYIAEDGVILELVRRRKLPIIGSGAGMWSFLHLDDAATATLAAVERGAPGVYNIADDEPAPVAVWLPELAKIIGAKPPHHIPAWLGRLAAGEPGVSIFTQIRGTVNGEGEARARLAASLPELARRIPPRSCQYPDPRVLNLLQPDGLPVLRERGRAQPDGLPVQRERSRARPDSLPVQRERSRVQPDGLPAQRERSRVQPDSLPVQRERSRVRPDRLPVQRERSRVRPDGLLVQRERSRVQPDRLPAQRDHVGKSPARPRARQRGGDRLVEERG